MGGQHRDHAARGQQSEKRQEQLDQRGPYRAIDHQQHARDRDEGDQGDLTETGVADDVQVVGERGGTRDIGLNPGWRFRLLDDLAYVLNAFVGQGLALFAGQVQHHVGGLAVGALRPGRGQRVAPEILDVLDVLGILLQLVDDLVVVVVRVRAERLLALDDDHDRAVGVELLEVGAHQLHRLHRWGVLGRHRRRVQLADDLELRGDHVDENGDDDPEQDDRQRKDADQAGHERPLRRPGGLRLGDGVGHADFTRQYVWALTPLADCSSRTVPFTVTRHPI